MTRNNRVFRIPGAVRQPRQFGIHGLAICLIGAIASDTLLGQDVRPESRPASGDQPIARAISPLHDFGKIVEGRRLSHVFKMMNAGRKPLEILKVTPDCTCMEAGKHPSVIEPGATGEFPVTVSTARMLGPFVKNMNVLTNDPVTPTVTFSMTGEGRRLVEITPVTAGFGRILDNDVHEQVVTLTNRSEAPMTASITSSAKAGNYEFELVESIPGFEFKLFVVLRPPYKEGTLAGNVTIKTNVEGQNTIQVSAMAIVLPRLELQPNTLYIGESTAPAIVATKPVIKVVQFSNHDAQKIHILSAECDDPAIIVSTKEVDPGRLYRVFVQMPPDYRPPLSGRTVKLITNIAEKPEILIPIRLTGAAVRPKTSPLATTSAPATAPQKPVLELIGKAAPKLGLTTAAGLPLNSDEFKRFPATVLNFVAPDCPFCKRQIPNVEKIRAEYEPKGVRFVNVGETLHNKTFTQAEAQVVFDGLGSHLELAMDPGNQHGNAYKITSFPALVVVAKDGVVADALPGARVENMDKLRKALEGLLVKEAGGK